MRRNPLAHVLWIGGPPGSGKSSVARRLAHAHDLRVYHADAYTWNHHDRAVAADLRGSSTFEAMTPDERWLNPSPEAMATLSLEVNRERCRMMIEDLRALPPTPLIVAEGTPLLPSHVAPWLESPEHAVWLVPTAGFERALLEARPTTTFDGTSDPASALENRIQRELRVGAEIERQARERGLNVVRVDGTTDLGATALTVESRFARILESGPCATRADERRTMRRAENETVFRQVLAYVTRVPAAGSPETYSVGFSCECGRSGCGDHVQLTISEAASRLENGPGSVAAPEHSRKVR